MPTSIPLGAPIWADSNTPNLAADLAFYTRLFGWTTFDSGEQYDHYTEFCLGTTVSMARAVGGIAANSHGDPDKPASWGVSFHVPDCVQAASEAEKLGAVTITHPMRVGDDFVLANLRDPDGGTFGLFEPLNDAMGFTAFGEPGAIVWFEYVYDGVPIEAMQFYSELLDWTVTVPPWEEPANETPYVSLRTRETGVEFGGCRTALGPESDQPPHWTVCFGTRSVDRTAARAIELGGSVLIPPVDDDPGVRTAVLASPTGARFEVMSDQA